MSSVIEGGIKKKEETDQLIQFEITDIECQYGLADAWYSHAEPKDSTTDPSSVIIDAIKGFEKQIEHFISEYEHRDTESMFCLSIRFIRCLFSDFRGFKLPEFFSKFNIKMVISDCPNLTSLEHLPTDKFVYLSLQGNDKLESLKTDHGFDSLKLLDIYPNEPKVYTFDDLRSADFIKSALISPQIKMIAYERFPKKIETLHTRFDKSVMDLHRLCHDEHRIGTVVFFVSSICVRI